MFAIRVIRGTWNACLSGLEVMWKHHYSLMILLLQVLVLFECRDVMKERESFLKQLSGIQEDIGNIVNSFKADFSRIKQLVKELEAQTSESEDDYDTALEDIERRLDNCMAYHDRIQSLEALAKEFSRFSEPADFVHTVTNNVPVTKDGPPEPKPVLEVTYNGVVFGHDLKYFKFSETGSFSVTTQIINGKPSGRVDVTIGIRIFRRNAGFPPVLFALLECVTSSYKCSTENTWTFVAGDEIFLEHFEKESESAEETEVKFPGKTVVDIKLLLAGTKVVYLTLKD